MLWRIAVHSDEFEIFVQELNLGKNTIERTRKYLGLLEQKHNETTAVFIEKLQSGSLTKHFAR
jgi:hypothetical protein